MGLKSWMEPSRILHVIMIRHSNYLKKVDTACLLVNGCVITLQKIYLNWMLLSSVTQSLH